MQRVIFHIDMDAFFSQIEELSNPRLRGKPVIVCGHPHSRSVVSTSSYEARKYGIKSGMPVGQARKLCPHGVFIRGNPKKYVYTSVKILKELKDFTRLVEPFSVDEAFLEFENLRIESASGLAMSIKRRIYDRFGLTGSIGIGPNKFVAKMASGVQKPDGLTVIREGEFLNLFGDKDVSALWGVGDKTRIKLNRLGIITILDLAMYPERKLKSVFGIYGADLKAAANGKDDSPIIPYFQGIEPKSMGHEFTFPHDASDLVYLQSILLRLCEKVARRMRMEGYTGDTISVKIRDNEFNTITRQSKIEHQVDRDDIIYNTAKKLLKDNHKGRSLRLLGVSVSGLVKNTETAEEPMFSMDRKYNRFIRTMDSIRDKYGEGAIIRGAGIRTRGTLT
jgi:DNA polymerase-4